MKTLLFAVAVAATPALAFAEPTADPAKLSEHTRILASDEFEGRAPNTPGEEKTVAYLAQQMQALGLEPGGDIKDGKRGWTQDVPLAKFEIKGTPKLSLTVAGKVQPLTQGTEVAIRAAQTRVDKVTFADAPIVFVGYGVHAPERNWDDFKGVDLKGKIALVLVNDPDYPTGKGDFGGKAMTYYGRWTYKFEEAARRGALGVLIVHDTAAASYGWASVKTANTGPMFDIVRKNPSEKHTPVQGWMHADTVAALFKASNLDFATLSQQAQTRAFKPVTLNAQMSADYGVDYSVITSKNVVGQITGTTRPDETVIYSAHWDAFGKGAPDANGDDIYNGALDDATGLAAVLELARMYKAAPRTERTVVFLAVTGEEKGLLGSEHYAANPLHPLAKTAANINIDMLGVYGPTKDVTTFGLALNSLRSDLEAIAKSQGRSYSPPPSLEAGYFYRSDHFSLSKRGVPALSFATGDDLVDGGRAAGEAARSNYNLTKYHQPDDEWTPQWDFNGQVPDMQAMYRLGRDIADSRRWPEWDEGSEFKAARDASKAERQ